MPDHENQICLKAMSRGVFNCPQKRLMNWELLEASGTYPSKIGLSKRFFLIPIKAFVYALLFNYVFFTVIY